MLEPTCIPCVRMILARDMGVGRLERLGGRGWAQSDGMRSVYVCVCVQGSLALNLFHMTHTHMASVWTLSFCLSECLHLSLPLSHSLWVVQWRKRGGGRGCKWGVGQGGVEVDISQPQQELCDDMGQAMSHTRDSGCSPLSCREGFIKYPLLLLAIYLSLSLRSNKNNTTLLRTNTPPQPEYTQDDTGG